MNATNIIISKPCVYLKSALNDSVMLVVIILYCGLEFVSFSIDDSLPHVGTFPLHHASRQVLPSWPQTLVLCKPPLISNTKMQLLSYVYTLIICYREDDDNNINGVRLERPQPLQNR